MFSNLIAYALNALIKQHNLSDLLHMMHAKSSLINKYASLMLKYYHLFLQHFLLIFQLLKK